MLTKLYDDHSYVVMTHLHMKYESTVQYVVNRMLSFMVHYCTCKHLSHLAQQVHMKDISHFVSDHNLQLSLFPLAPNQVIVPERYRRDYDDIQGKFVLLFDEITELFENEESVTMSKLKRFLSRYPNLKASLGNADTIADVMDMIQEQSSFTCCSYLKHTATRFNITVAVEKINDYYKSVDEFCQHVLRHHVYMQPFTTAKSINITDSEIISFKLEWSPDTKTLSDIQSLLRHAFDEQSVYVRIVVVRGGSVRVICCAPQYLMTELVRLAQKNRELLVESSVTYLRVGDTIVVDTSDQNEVRICYHRNCVTFDFMQSDITCGRSCLSTNHCTSVEN